LQLFLGQARQLSFNKRFEIIKHRFNVSDQDQIKTKQTVKVRHLLASSATRAPFAMMRLSATPNIAVAVHRGAKQRGTYSLSAFNCLGHCFAV